MELAEFLSTELDAMLRFARVLVGDRSTAEDIVQDVVTRLVAQPDRLPTVDHPTAYVRRMIVNEYVSWGRKWFRIKFSADIAISATSRDPADTIAEADDLRTALAQLPRNQRTVLVLRYYAGLDDDEIARTLGCSPGTVRSFAANRRLGAQCESLVRASCPRGVGLPSSWGVGAHEIVVAWSQVDLPSIAVPITRMPGRKTSIDGRRAWIATGAAEWASCPRDAASSVTATIDAESSSYPALRYIMTACLGPATSTRDRALLYGMLRSLDVRTGTSLRRMALGFGAHVAVPANWYHAPYRGIPSTLGAPDGYLSTAPLGQACTIQSPQDCLGPNWFPAAWQTPDSGALMLWATFEYPVAARGAFASLPGHRTTIDGRAAKLYQGAPTDSCPASTYRELDAYVQRGPLDTSSPRFQLTACFGRGASTPVRRSVLAMVHSFRIGN